jgi:hypothetical protein
VTTAPDSGPPGIVVAPVVAGVGEVGVIWPGFGVGVPAAGVAAVALVATTGLAAVVLGVPADCATVAKAMVTPAVRTPSLAIVFIVADTGLLLRIRLVWLLPAPWPWPTARQIAGS